jgi:hypothetical protein
MCLERLTIIFLGFKGFEIPPFYDDIILSGPSIRPGDALGGAPPRLLLLMAFST